MAICPFCENHIESNLVIGKAAVLDACTNCMNPVVLYKDGVDELSRAPKGVRDIRDTARGESIGAVILKALPAAIERIPMLPEISQQVLGMTSDPEVSMEDLADVVMQDQVLAGKILQVANSALYGGLVEIKDLQAACARLGMKNICNTVQTVASGNVYKISNPAYTEMMHNIWRHAIATAHGSSELAMMLAEPNSELLFVAGLIHDIGNVVLLDIIANEDAPSAEMLRGSDELLLEVLSGYHALTGLHVVKHWGLPAEFYIAAYCHKYHEAVPGDDWLSFVHIVDLASDVATITGFGFEPEEDASLVNHPSARFFGLNDIRLATLRVDVEDRVAKMVDVFSAAA